MPTGVQVLQRSIATEYVTSIGLQPATYYGGARLRPVVPLDTAIGGIFILGAYPSARFEVVGTERNVPVGDNLGPFEPERYFDGERVRSQASSDELAEFYFAPLGVRRDQCWITDLVKVFLFKDGHRDKYTRLGATPPPGYERERFEELGRLSLPWIHREVAVAKPRIVITLGAEVAGMVRGITSNEARVKLLGPEPVEVLYGTTRVPTVHLAHPGIVMRKGGEDSTNPWPRIHTEEHIPRLKAVLQQLGLRSSDEDQDHRAVCEAEERRLKRRFDIKFLRDQATEDDIARFRREAELLASLSHPNVVKVFDFGEHEGRPYLVMEYLDGNTLADHLHGAGDDGLPLDVALGFGRQLCEAVEAVHRQGVVHRDIRPATVVVTSGGTRAVLRDFGLAHAAVAVEERRTVSGVPQYLPPEVIRGAPLSGDSARRSDIYALGCTLYELMVGRPPFFDDNPLMVLHQHLHDPPPRLGLIRPDVPLACEEAILRALDKDPSRRPSSSDLAGVFRRLVPGSGAPPSR